jgi:uncharacterized protein
MQLLEAVVGFLIALCVATTGIGAGSFTTPALVLLFGLPAAEAVGTALVFSFILRLAVAPLYAFGKRIHFRYLRLMLSGGIPGILLGVWFLKEINTRRWNPVIEIVIGALLVFSAVFSLFRARLQSAFRAGRTAWLPWIALPIGFETGVSAAGAGAMGTMILLHCPEISSTEAVGTDLSFGLVLAGLGAGFHSSAGTVSGDALKALLAGAIPGILLGCYLARKVSSPRLRGIMLASIAVLGLQLVWTGGWQLTQSREIKSAAALSFAAEPNSAPNDLLQFYWKQTTYPKMTLARPLRDACVTLGCRLGDPRAIHPQFQSQWFLPEWAPPVVIHTQSTSDQ